MGEGNASLRVDVAIPSTISNLATVDKMTAYFVAAYDLTPEEREFVNLAVHEAVANAIVHGNKEDSALFVTVSYFLKANAFIVEVSDEGAGFDPNSLPDPREPENLLRPHGRGLLFVRSFMDTVEFDQRPEGLRVTLTKNGVFQGFADGDEECTR